MVDVIRIVGTGMGVSEGFIVGAAVAVVTGVLLV
jgi:hypothetical protein